MLHLGEADAVLGDRLGAPLSRLCFEGPDTTLNRTDVSQPAIYTASIASWRGLLAQWGLAPSEAPLVATAGLSLGEYTALHIAGAIEFEVGLDLVARRGAAMQRAAESSDGSMLALIGVVNIPIIHFSVEWWNSLHQGATITKFDQPSIAPEMLWPLLMNALGFTLYFGAVQCMRMRTLVLSRERDARWVRELLG